MLDLAKYDQVFILTDEQVAPCCLPVLSSLSRIDQPNLADLPTLVLPSGEQHKNLASVGRIWDFLLAHNATRRSLMINLGGGVICDMGGFAAATFKRGIDFINIPTTLLAMVDAALGGKTGFDYGNLKNSIGVFAEPADVIIEPRFLATLPPEQLLSGFAEMIKHALLQGQQAFNELMNFDLREVSSDAFGRLIEQSVAFKQSIASQDPHDHGLRQQLNFGHTVGHAIEALCLVKHNPIVNSKYENRKYLHGYCVMYGLVAEAFMSHVQCGLPTEVVSTLSRFMMQNYGSAPVSCSDYDALMQLMRQDKKNTEQDTIRCTLLQTIGQPLIGQTVTPELLREALEYLCSL